MVVNKSILEFRAKDFEYILGYFLAFGGKTYKHYLFAAIWWLLLFHLAIFETKHMLQKQPNFFALLNHCICVLCSLRKHYLGLLDFISVDYFDRLKTNEDCNHQLFYNKS